MSTPEERKFYASKQWRNIRKAALWRDGGLCVLCRNHGIVTPATEIDHKIPIKENPSLKLVLENLQSLCHDCHTKKTAADYRPTPRFCIHGMPINTCQSCMDISIQ